MRTTHFTSAARAALAATAAALLLSPAAHAAAKKPAAPPLTIEAKACNIGPDAEDRTAVVTALASYDGTGDKVQLRFGLQQRFDAKNRWRTVTGTANGDLSTWTTTDASATDLRYTKTITNLAEGMQYRVAVDARSVTVAGKAASAQRRRYVTCKQPQFTPKLQLTYAIDSATTAGQHTVSVIVRNLGRLVAPDATVTVADDTTRATLGTAPVPALKGNGTLKLQVPITSCDRQLLVSVQPDDAAPADILPGQSQIVGCAGSSTAKRMQAKRR